MNASMRDELIRELLADIRSVKYDVNVSAIIFFREFLTREASWRGCNSRRGRLLMLIELYEELAADARRSADSLKDWLKQIDAAHQNYLLSK